MIVEWSYDQLSVTFNQEKEFFLKKIEDIKETEILAKSTDSKISNNALRKDTQSVVEKYSKHIKDLISSIHELGKKTNYCTYYNWSNVTQQN